MPAKIPLGMTEREYWAVTQIEERDEDIHDLRLRGLNDDSRWREMRNALPDFDSRRDTG